MIDMVFAFSFDTNATQIDGAPRPERRKCVHRLIALRNAAPTEDRIHPDSEEEHHPDQCNNRKAVGPTANKLECPAATNTNTMSVQTIDQVAGHNNGQRTLAMTTTAML
jgi:hypothetical protein